MVRAIRAGSAHLRIAPARASAPAAGVDPHAGVDPAPDHLVAAIESVLAQAYADWELCIVDDASTNEAIAVRLASAAGGDTRIHVLRRATNGGIAAATNDALASARGEYLCVPRPRRHARAGCAARDDRGGSFQAGRRADVQRRGQARPGRPAHRALLQAGVGRRVDPHHELRASSHGRAHRSPAPARRHCDGRGRCAGLGPRVARARTSRSFAHRSRSPCALSLARGQGIDGRSGVREARARPGAGRRARSEPRAPRRRRGGRHHRTRVADRVPIACATAARLGRHPVARPRGPPSRVHHVASRAHRIPGARDHRRRQRFARCGCARVSATARIRAAPRA